MVASIARTLVLDETLAVVPPRWQSQQAPDLYWGFKDPGDVLDYSVSLVAWLADVADTIATATCTVTPSSAAVTATTSASGLVTTMVSGGVAGQRYGVAWSVATAGGRTVDFTVWLDCQDRNSQPGQGMAALSYQLAVASTATLGGVIIGSGVTVDAGGTISVTPSGGGAVASVAAGTGLAGGTITGTGTLSLNAATATSLGGVLVGTGLAVNAGGTLSNAGVLSLGTILPAVASGSLLGTNGVLNSASAVVVGANLTLGSGTLSAAAPGTGTVTSIVAGAGLSGGTITQSGTITLDIASTAALGGVIAGDGLSIDAGGTLSNDGVLALGGVAGSIALGANLSIATGTLNAVGGGSITVDTGAGLGGGPISTSGTIYAATPVTNTYTASGTIAVSDVISLVNTGSAAAMTLAAGTVDGHCVTVKRFGAGAVSVAAAIDGGSATVEMMSSTAKESLSLVWSAGNSTWLLI